MPRLPILLALCAAAACVDDPSAESELTAAPAPLTGVDGAVDQADRACHVVLRDLARLGNGTGGYQSNGTSWIWEGDVELSAAAVADGATAAVVFQYGSDPTWYQVATTPSATPATPGFVRFHVRLDDHLPGPGMSGTALTTRASR
jgi:hypothetical protein